VALLVLATSAQADARARDPGSFSTIAPNVNPAGQGKPSPMFEGTAEATEEAIVNVLVAARTMTGINAARVYGIPHDGLRSVLKRYNRLEASK
jgi:L-aminopeptidase/D-esterase-like protein